MTFLQLLIDESPLQVLPSLAQRIGLNEAIILQQIHYWLNPAHNDNVFENHHWVWNTYEQWQQQFPFWSERTIRRTILRLEEMSLLKSFVSCDFRKNKYYTIDYQRLAQVGLWFVHDHTGIQQVASQDQELISAGQNEQIENSKMTDQGQHDPIDRTKWTDQTGQNNLKPLTKMADGSQYGLTNGTKRPDPSVQHGLIHQANVDSSYIETETTTETTLHPPRAKELLEWSTCLPSICQQARQEKIQPDILAGNILPFPASQKQKFLMRAGSKRNKPTDLSSRENLPNSPPKQEARPIQVKACDTNPADEEKLQTLLAAWNDIVQEELHPGQPAYLTPKRTKNLITCLENVLKDKLNWAEYCHKIANSRFLMGQNPSGFKVSLDWALNAHNARKVLEGVIYDKPIQDQPIEESWEELVEKINQCLPEQSFTEEWLAICKLLIKTLDQQVFKSWFLKVGLVDFTEVSATLQIENEFKKTYLMTHFYADLLKAIQTHYPTVERITFQVAQQNKLQQQKGETHADQ